MTTDWRSYDEIASRYDEIWAPRFEQAARRIWSWVQVPPGARVLDVGTGTGIVPRVLVEGGAGPSLVVGCDRSTAMLRHAAAAVPRLRVMKADATRLPFAADTFAVLTASFVLSHLASYHSALAEMRRVLVGGGTLAVSAWGPTDDPCSAVWRECLADAVPKEEMDRALAEVAPAETRFSDPAAIEAALRDAGFVDPLVDEFTVEVDTDVDRFMDDREMNSGGRFARSVLSAERWDQFRAETHDAFRSRFGASFRYRRRAHIVRAAKR